MAGVYGGQTDSQSKPYTPRRAVMYVPGNDQKKIQKVTSLDLDCAVLDCEDGVAANKKVKFLFGSHWKFVKMVFENLTLEHQTCVHLYFGINSLFCYF